MVNIPPYQRENYLELLETRKVISFFLWKCMYRLYVLLTYMTINSYTVIILYVLYAFDIFHILLSGDSLRDLWNVYMYVCVSQGTCIKTMREPWIHLDHGRHTLWFAMYICRGRVVVLISVHYSCSGFETTVLGKGLERCRSLPSVALRSFLNGTRVSQNTTRNELLLRACAFTCGRRRSESGWQTKFRRGWTH